MSSTKKTQSFSAEERAAMRARAKELKLAAEGESAIQAALAEMSPEEIYRLIQEAAYYKAKARGFAPGHEVQDWIEAEAEVRLRLDSRA